LGERPFDNKSLAKKMCGINGFNWKNEEMIELMNETIKHRGPDDSGQYIDEGISLGHRRLSIIDLTKAGHQPMCNEDETIWLTYNGEIYNFKEIRRVLVRKGHKFKSDTDSEIIIHAYEEYGTDCLNHFNGMFAFCIYDKKKEILFLARDRIGIKPLYYYQDRDRFIFSSEIKTILKHKIKKTINKRAMQSYFTYRFVYGEETIFNNIRRLLSSHYMIFDLKTKNSIIMKYWEIQESISKENEKNKLLLFLIDSIEKRLVSDVPVGVYLSGGVDSSAIVAIMSKFKTKIKTFSVGFKDGESELEEARKIAKMFGTEHKEIIINDDLIEILPELMWYFDEPFADPAALPMYELSKEASKDVKVVLTGDGGDELYAGYDQYKFLKLRDDMKCLPKFIRKILAVTVKNIPRSIINRFYKYGSENGTKLIERFSKFISTDDDTKAYDEVMGIFDEDELRELTGEIKHNQWRFDDRFHPLHSFNKILQHDIKNLLPEGYLMKTDRTTMAFGIEARVPLLDHRLVEHSFRISPKDKMGKKVFKKALRGVLPNEVLNRKKQSFHLPIDKWIEKKKEKYQSYLEKGEAVKDKLIKKSCIKKIFKDFNNAKLFYARQIWSLLCFEAWYKGVMK